MQRNAENSTLTTAVQLATTTAASLVNTTISVNYTTQFDAIQASYAANTINTVSESAACQATSQVLAWLPGVLPSPTAAVLQVTLHNRAPCLCAAVDLLPAGQPDPGLGGLYPCRVRLRSAELRHFWSEQPQRTHWR